VLQQGESPGRLGHVVLFSVAESSHTGKMGLVCPGWVYLGVAVMGKGCALGTLVVLPQVLS